MNPRTEPFPGTMGEMARRVSALDWSRTALGAVDAWPQSLRCAVGICLGSRLPLSVWWGPDLLSIHNDACIPLLGARHPDALGQPARTVWAELWDSAEPQVEAAVQRGESSWNARVPVWIDREGQPREALLTWSLSPIPDESGAVSGVLCTFLDETERAATEEALAEARRRLDAALLAGPIGTFTWSVEANRLAGDEAFTKFFGVGSQAGGGAPLADFLAAIHPEDRRHVADRIAEAVDEGSDLASEFRVAGPDRVRWLSARARVERDGLGRVARLNGSVREVTERRKAEEALRDSEATLNAVIEGLPIGVGLVAADGRTLLLNRAGLEAHGFASLQEMLVHFEHYRTDFELRDLDGRILPADEWPMTRALRGEPVREFEVRLRRLPDGPERVVSYSAVPVSGGEARVAFVMQDVTDRVRAQRSLRRAAARDAFRVRLNDALRPLGDPAEIQEAAARTLGRHLGATRVHYAEVSDDAEYGLVRADHSPGLPSVVGRHRLDDYGPSVMQEFRAGRTLVIHDVAGDPRLTPAEKDATAALLVAAYVMVPIEKGNRPVGLLVVHQSEPRAWTKEEVETIEETAERTWEAVERGRAEAALREAKEVAEEASASKSRFLAVMSHELRTPLTGVIGFAGLLEGEVLGPMTAKQRDAVSRIQTATWHLVGIINEILTLSRAEAGKEEIHTEEVDLAALTLEVAGFAEPQALARGLDLRVDGADRPAVARTDPGKVRQILINLVGNAIKYTEEGHVTIQLDRSGPDGLEVHVHDSGPGIALSEQERIFEPFTQVDNSLTRRSSGTGLGLAIARRLARLLGGDVTVRSEMHVGSTFTLRLPRNPPAQKSGPSGG